MKDSSVVPCRCVLMLTLYLSVSQRVNNTTEPEPRRERWWVRARESVARAHLITSCVNGFFLSSVKTALLGQFSPTGAHREDCGPLCEQCCRYPWIASLENTSALSAHTPYKQRSWCRPASFEATGYYVQHKVCLHVEVARRKWVVVSTGYFLSSRRQRQNSTATPVVEQREHARGHCVGLGICHAW